MTSPPIAAPQTPDKSPGTATRALGRGALLLGLAAVLALLLLVGLFVGNGGYSISEVWNSLTGNIDNPTIEYIIREDRLPRTLLAALIGAALGVAGAIMQGLTRNPLADPGILGVNSGAYFAMVIGAVAFGANGLDFTWWALLGAFAASILVYFVGSRGAGGASPAKLVLTGVAIASMLSGFAFGLTMTDRAAFDTIRALLVGTLNGRNWEQFDVAWIPILIGLVAAVALCGFLNALALGDDRARALGVPVTWVRAAGFAVVTLLCGAATAALGPVTFIGLMVPHAVRSVVGADHRWLVPVCMLVGPIVLVGSDIIGRVASSSELPVGMVTAFIGAPVLIWMARKDKGGGW